MKNKIKSFKAILDLFPTNVRLDDGSFAGKRKKQSLYFGCNYTGQPTICIKWSEKGRGFGEYVFYEKDGKLYCDNECDDKVTVMRVMCQLVNQAIFTSPKETKCSVLKVSSSSKRKSTTTTSRKSQKDS